MSYRVFGLLLLIATLPVSAQTQSTSYDAAFPFKTAVDQFKIARMPEEAQIEGIWILNGKALKNKSVMVPNGILTTKTREYAQTLIFHMPRVKVIMLDGVVDPEDTKVVGHCDVEGRPYLCFQYAGSGYACGFARDGDLLCRALHSETKVTVYRRYRGENRIQR